jgi:1-acyl-sn-glycerol-3-phosphate acyltransferase
MELHYWLKRAVERSACLALELRLIPRINRYFNVQISGLENLPERPVIIVPNHCLTADGIIIKMKMLSHTNRIIHFWVQKEGVYERFGNKVILWSAGDIPVKVDGRSDNSSVFERTRQYLEWTDNDFIGVFSEGPSMKLLDKEGNMIPIEERKHYPGAAWAAITNGVPIVPIDIRSSEVIEIEARKYNQSNKKGALQFIEEYTQAHGKQPYYINIGKPIYPSILRPNLPERERKREERRATRDLTEVVRKEVIRLAQTARD